MAVRFLVAERFHRWPWEIDEAPTDRLLETIRLMGLIPPAPAVVIQR
jgi:hypothetical protein